MRYNNNMVDHCHQRHKLKLDCSKYPFKCNGCEEAGIGKRYRCGACDYDLHLHCASPSPTIHHPFYKKYSFRFFSSPPGNKPRFCDACERDVKGFVYHCEDSGYDLHPCCAKLPANLDDGKVQLHLYKKLSGSCDKCGRKGKGKSWGYRSACKNYNLHVGCAKDMMVESWHDRYHGGAKSDLVGSHVTSSNGEDGGAGVARQLETKIPRLKNTLHVQHRRKNGKVQAWYHVARLAVKVVISAVLGDPTALIAAVVLSFIKN